MSPSILPIVFFTRFVRGSINWIVWSFGLATQTPAEPKAIVLLRVVPSPWRRARCSPTPT
jgi:hypothetical protein